MLFASWIVRIHRIQTRIILNRHLPLHPLLINRKRAIRRDQMPLRFIISGRLTRNNRMLPNLIVCTLRRIFVRLRRIVGAARVFVVQRLAGEFAPVEAGGLLGGVVAEADGDHFLTVRGAEIQAVGGFLVAEGFLLEFHDLDYGFIHCAVHGRNGILFLPGILRAVVREVGYVHRGSVLGVGTA